VIHIGHTNYFFLEKLCRALDLLSPALDLLSRELDLIFYYIISRALDTIFQEKIICVSNMYHRSVPTSMTSYLFFKSKIEWFRSTEMLEFRSRQKWQTDTLW